MKVLLFGATGMIGRGVLLECLREPSVEAVVTWGRAATGMHDSKLHEMLHTSLLDYSGVENDLAGLDARFFCLGVASTGMKEADYVRVTYDITMTAAEALCCVNPGMRFTLSPARARTPQRKKAQCGRASRDVPRMRSYACPFRSYMIRPGFIRPLDGIRSKTPLYRTIYPVLGPILRLLSRAMPDLVLTTRQIGRAMLTVANHGCDTGSRRSGYPAWRPRT